MICLRSLARLEAFLFRFRPSSLQFVCSVLFLQVISLISLLTNAAQGASASLPDAKISIWTFGLILYQARVLRTSCRVCRTSKEHTLQTSCAAWVEDRKQASSLGKLAWQAVKHGSRLTQVKSLSKAPRLHKVRNPHHTNEWFGKFHDDDWETWNAYPEVRLLGFSSWPLQNLGSPLSFASDREALKATGHKVGIKDSKWKASQCARLPGLCS